MKLQGIILPESVAVSTPTIVPVGALRATVKLLIVIVMNLSRSERGLPPNSPRCSLKRRSALGIVIFARCYIYTYYNNLSISNHFARKFLTRKSWPSQGAVARGFETLARAHYAVVI
jgi:hypothetical protein